MHTPNTAPVLAVALTADAQAITLTTRGFVHVHSEREAKDRCGPKGATRQLDYTVTVTSSPAFLDEQGFLIDWQTVQRYFLLTYNKVQHFPSCEQIGVKSVRDIADMLPGRCQGVTVKVAYHGGPADLEARWDAPVGWWQAGAEREHFSHTHIQEA